MSEWKFNLKLLLLLIDTEGGLNLSALPFPYRTVFATVTVPFIFLTVRSAKRTEPLILTVRILVFEPIINTMRFEVPNNKRITVLNTKRLTKPVLVQYGSRSSVINE